eukprot:6580537-Pyramimonas_sp.AAC.1
MSRPSSCKIKREAITIPFIHSLLGRDVESEKHAKKQEKHHRRLELNPVSRQCCHCPPPFSSTSLTWRARC